VAANDFYSIFSAEGAEGATAFPSKNFLCKIG